MSKLPDFETLQEAKEHLRENWEKGTDCPCCGQFVKLYKRKLNSSMAYVLILMMNRENRFDEDGWVHVEKYLKSMKTAVSLRGDYAKLRYWQLIEQMENTDTSKKDSGFWRITERGVKFAKGDIALPKRVNLYNGKIVGWDEDHSDIKEALGDKFDYAELMGF